VTRRRRTLAGDLEALQRAWRDFLEALYAERVTLGLALILSAVAISLLAWWFDPNAPK
jgi:hypothetical protein